MPKIITKYNKYMAIRKSKKKKSSLIILTRNEIDGMRALVGRIPFEAVDEAFVVDYKSDDGTVDFVKKRGIKLVEQIHPGRGEAFRIAAQQAKGDFLIFFSPDGNEDPHDIPKLIKMLEDGADMAIASRFLPGSRNEEDDQFLKFRLWANQAFTLVVNLIWNSRGKYITDTINGYRAIRKKAFNQLHLDSTGYAIEYQMTIRALKQGMKIKEISTIEGNRIGGESKASSIPTGLKFISLLINELFLSKI